MNHTKEPWAIYPETDGTDICAVDFTPGLPIRQVICHPVRGENWIANARRIVACVNACAGWPTLLLESVVTAGSTLQKESDSLAVRAAKTEQQRDSLLAAAKKLGATSNKGNYTNAMEAFLELMKVVDSIEEQMK